MLTGIRLSSSQTDHFHTEKDSCTEVKSLLQRELEADHVRMDLEKENSRRKSHDRANQRKREIA